MHQRATSYISPTLLTGAHPNVVYGVYLANAIGPKATFASIIGSYGWGTKIVDQIAGMIPNLNVEVLDPVLIKGVPKTQDFAALDTLAEKITTKHRELGILA